MPVSESDHTSPPIPHAAGLHRLLCMGLLMALSLAAPVQATPLTLVEVAEDSYALIGPLGNRDPENLGNNANFGFIVTAEGVVLIDPGGSHRGAAAIAEAIAGVTAQPVRLVINTGGQDHRWLGNAYFKARGARILASAAAVADQRARARDQLFVLNRLIGAEGLEGTEAVHADETFEARKVLEFGGVRIELHHAGPAHTPGDAFVWLPQRGVLFSGDIVYVQRMLGVIEVSDSRNWLAAFAAIEALSPAVLVPGHGAVTDLAQARADTRDYLSFLRERVGAFMAAGGGIEGVGRIDQSRFAYLENYETLQGRNAQQVYAQMEWE
jgi:glyoxylase-like metal-dependent hydrolase (beta-lactamase superfamily II)